MGSTGTKSTTCNTINAALEQAAKFRPAAATCALASDKSSKTNTFL